VKNSVILKESKNFKKDQSYFLSLIPKENLKKIVFPIGDIENKRKTRSLVEEFGLPNFQQKESQDICFITEGDYKNFLKTSYPNLNLFVQGNIKLKDPAKVIGKHSGIANYTIGQRKGLGISYQAPLYVKKLNISDNEIIVGAKNETPDDLEQFYVDEFNWLSASLESFTALVKLRSNCKKIKSKITKINATEILVQLLEHSPVPITCGQICAVYNDEGVILGGGIIKG
jgi:tRNA-specific 2-thiouridylase